MYTHTFLYVQPFYLNKIYCVYNLFYSWWLDTFSKLLMLGNIYIFKYVCIFYHIVLNLFTPFIVLIVDNTYAHNFAFCPLLTDHIFVCFLWCNFFLLRQSTRFLWTLIWLLLFFYEDGGNDFDFFGSLYLSHAGIPIKMEYNDILEIHKHKSNLYLLRWRQWWWWKKTRCYLLMLLMITWKLWADRKKTTNGNRNW